MNRPRCLPSRRVTWVCSHRCVALCTCLALAAALCPATFATADECAPARWDRYRTPSHEDLLVLPGSDIDCFATGGADGSTIYAIGTWNSPCANDTPDDPFSPHGMLRDSGQAPRLWKSTDGGVTWRDRTARVLEAANLPDAGAGDYDDFLCFTAIAAGPDDPGIVVVAGYDRNGRAVVAGSRDGAEEFTWLGCGAVDGMILCASISPTIDGTRRIAVGTTDPLNGGRVWRYDTGRGWSGVWVDTALHDGWTDYPLWGGDAASVYAVTSVAFSPRYLEDSTILAVVVAQAEEPDGDPYQGFYLVTGRWDATDSWNGAAGLADRPLLVRDGGQVIHAPSPLPLFLLRGLTDMALPADYDGERDADRVALISVNGIMVEPSSGSLVAEGGFLFWVQGGTASRELLRNEGNPWVASIAYHGDADMRGSMLIGASCPDAWTWDDIVDWHNAGSPALSCCKGVPVLFSTENEPCCPRWDRAEQPPSGQFNAQVAWSPSGEAAYASTSGRGRLWHDGQWYADESAFSRSTSAITEWEQTGLVDTMIEEIVAIADDPASGTLYLHTRHTGEDGSVCTCESIWRTVDEGAAWVRQLHGRPATDDADEDAFDDIIDDYYRGFYSARSEGYLQAAGVRYVIGDAIDEDDDQQVDAGLAADTVYRLLEGRDSDWDRMTPLVLDYTRLVYMACGDSPGGTLYVGFDSVWWDFTTNEPLPYEAGGSAPTCPSGHDCRVVSGAARYLTVGSNDCCPEYEWDYLIRGLRGSDDEDGVREHLQLAGASCRGCFVRLWAIDRGSDYWARDGEDTDSYDWCAGRFSNDLWGRLWKYDDCYAMAPVAAISDDDPLTVPSDPCACANEEFVLEWDRLCDACQYDIQIATDRRFTHVALETEAFLDASLSTATARFYLPPDPAQPCLLVAKGMLDCNQSYWWRVRAHMAETDEVIRSWWSEPGVFFTAPGPPGLIELRAPGDGATRVAVKNVGFTWTAVSGATRYDFMLVDLEQGHVASKVGDFTAFVLPLTLEFDTSYVWRVIALDGDRVITESARATFRTEPQPAAPSEAAVGATLVPPAAASQPDWIRYFAGILALLLAALLVVLSRVNRRLRRRRSRDVSPDSRFPTA